MTSITFGRDQVARIRPLLPEGVNVVGDKGISKLTGEDFEECPAFFVLVPGMVYFEKNPWEYFPHEKCPDSTAGVVFEYTNTTFRSAEGGSLTVSTLSPCSMVWRYPPWIGCMYECCFALDNWMS